MRAASTPTVWAAALCAVCTLLPAEAVKNGCQCGKEQTQDMDYCVGVQKDTARGRTTPEECCEFCRSESIHSDTITTFVWARNRFGSSEPNCFCKEPCVKDGPGWTPEGGDVSSPQRVRGAVKDPSECELGWGLIFMILVASGPAVYLVCGAFYVLKVKGYRARRPSELVAHPGFWTALMGMVVDGFLYATSMFSAAPYDAQKGTAYQQAPEEFNIGGHLPAPTVAGQSGPGLGLVGRVT